MHFYSVPDHFGTLCIKSLICISQRNNISSRKIELFLLYAENCFVMAIVFSIRTGSRSYCQNRYYMLSNNLERNV